MKLVIEIDKSIYDCVIGKTVLISHVDKICKAIADGTPLPKGHGRLGDLDALEIEMSNGIKAGLMFEGYESYSHINDMDDCLECVKYASTIIEAEKENKYGRKS